jgi:hypothetical protein
MTLAELWRTPGIKTLMLCALASAIFTTSLFIYTLDRRDEQVVGTVISATTETIVIADPNNQTLTLLLTPNTKTRALGPLDELTPGTLVIAGGKRISTSTIEAFGVRRVEKRLDRPRNY